MALTAAFLNVVLRREAYEGLDAQRRWIARQAFQWRKPWFRFDDHLMATTFLVPKDVRAFCTWLETRTGLVRDRDHTVWDTAFGPSQPVDWLEGDVDHTAIGWVALKGEPDQPRDPIVDLLPGPCRRITYAMDRDSLNDPEDGEGRKRRPEGTPDWGGKGLWLFAKPGVPDPKDVRVPVPMVTEEFSEIEGYLDQITGRTYPSDLNGVSSDRL